ncbi:MAG: response regulator transcription factor [Gammaproteobacteria bacterium]
MNILLLEDNSSLNDILKDELSKQGFLVEQTYTITEATELLSLKEFQLGIFDAMLPDGLSFKLIKKIRASNIVMPIILVTAKDSIEDRVEGLDAGADDYLVKPFNFKELNARIRALMRRPSGVSNEIIEFADLSLNLLSKELFIDSRACKISKKEFYLLELFLKKPESLLNATQIANAIYQLNQNITPNAIEVLVHRLRKKLLDNQSKTTIQNYRGLGFKLEALND